MSFATPIVFIIFNRPEPTQIVFEAIRKQKPKTLFIIADGPRAHEPADIEKVKNTRQIVEYVDWDCDVHRLYAETNMGLKSRVSSGITQVFDVVEDAIILEDDCLPSDSFFTFCADLLERYRHNEQIMMISGDNFVERLSPKQYSYFFSIYPTIWGWATWRRAWAKYDIEMTDWQKGNAQAMIAKHIGVPKHFEHLASLFDRTLNNEFHTWDYQWAYSCLLEGGLTIIPSYNLITNIGFNADATHTNSLLSMISNLPRYELELPLQYPSHIEVHQQYDYHSYIRRNQLSKRDVFLHRLRLYIQKRLNP